MVGFFIEWSEDDNQAPIKKKYSCWGEVLSHVMYYNISLIIIKGRPLQMQCKGACCFVSENAIIT